MDLIKIECRNEEVLNSVKGIVDDHCVVEGLALLTNHDFTEQEVEKLMQITSSVEEPNEFDLEFWARHQ